MTIEVELPDGTIVEFPDGTAPDVMKKALSRFKTGKAADAPKAEAPKAEAPQYAPNGVPMNAAAKAEIMAKAKAGTLTVAPEAAGRQAMIDSLAANNANQGAFGAWAGNMAQGVTFGYADELAGLMGADTEALRMKRDMDEQTYPVATTGGDVTGALGTTAITAALTVPKALALAPASMPAKVALGTATGAAVGSGEGALSGAGYADGKNVLQEAKKGAVVGGALGGVIGGAAPLAMAGLKNAAQWIKGYDEKIVAKVLDVDKKTARTIKAALSADDPAKAMAALDRAGPDAMLADAGPGMSRLLDTSMQSSGSAARVAGERIESRAAKAATRLSNMFDNLLGQADEGMKSAARSIAQKSSAVRKAAYDKAFSTPINYADDTGRAVESVVKRVPKDKLTSAIKAANDAMQMEGRTSKQIMASIADDGTVTFSKPLDLEQLNELKIQLGEAARNAVDQFGRPTGEGLKIKALVRDLTDALGEAVPEYRRAVKLGGDKIAEDQALDLGRKMLSPNVTREQVIEGLRGAADDAVAAAKRGLRNYLDETMANVRAVISDPNVDAREALKVVKDMSSKAARQKVTTLLGAKKAEALFDTIEEATAHLELRAAVARNSATASRLAVQDEVKRAVGDTVVDAMRDGEPVNLAKRIWQTFTGGSEARKTEAANALYTELAKALTGPRGAEARAAMATIEKALSGQPIKDAEAEAIARLLTTGGAIAGYQSGKQALASPVYGK